MALATDYAAAVAEVRRYVRAEISAGPGGCDSTLAVMYEYARTNLLHILRMTDAAEITELAERVVEEIMINRNVDHTPPFISRLTESLRVHDPGEVLTRTRDGAVYIFVGFHTGPYMSIADALLRNGTSFTALFPPALRAKKEDMTRLGDGMRSYHRVAADVQWLDIGAPNFLMHVRKHIRERRQLLVYIDGYGGYTAQENDKNDIETKFFNVDVLLKTTVSRLSSLLGIPIVAVNAKRSEGVERMLYLDTPIDVRELVTRQAKPPHSDVTARLFERLATHIARSPTQWEGWIYFNTFFSPGYLARIRGSKGGVAPRHMGSLGQYFVQSSGSGRVLVNRLTLECYKVRNEGQGNRGGGEQRQA